MLRTLVLLMLLALLVAAGCGAPPPDRQAAAEPAPTSSPPLPSMADAPATTTTTTVPAPTTTSTTVAPSTTTTMPPSTPAPVRHVASAGNVNGYPCGGDLPPCWVLRRESGGDPTAVTPTGCGGYSCGGLWQFDPRTWAGFGGYRYAQDAPAGVQNEKAAQLWAHGAGCAHWAACG